MPSKLDNSLLKSMLKKSDCQVSGRTLIVGAKSYADSDNRRDWYPDAVGIDIEPGPGVDLVHNIEQPLLSESFDHVDCCSVLEHIKRPWLAAQNIEKCLRKGGTILVSVPFVWRIHGYPSDYWRMTSEALEILFPVIDWRERVYTSNGDMVDRPQSYVVEGGKTLSRTELIGWGVKQSTHRRKTYRGYFDADIT